MLRHATNPVLRHSLFILESLLTRRSSSGVPAKELVSMQMATSYGHRL